MNAEVATIESVAKRVERALDEFGIRWVASEGFMRIMFEASTGEASLTVDLSVITKQTVAGDLPFVAMRAGLVIGIPLDGEGGSDKLSNVMGWTNDFNQDSFLLRAIWSIDEVNGQRLLSIAMETELLGAALDPIEIIIALSELEIAANGWDDKLADALGGVTWTKALQEFTSDLRLPTDA